MRTATAVLAITLLTFTCAYSHTDLTSTQVKALLDTGGNIVVVDVREES